MNKQHTGGGVMSDYTTLIAKLDRAHRMSCSDPDDPARETFYSMARDAIEALVKERDDERATRTANNGLARRVVDALRTRPGWVEPEKTPEGFGSMNFADVVLREVGRTERERDALAAEVDRLKLVHVGQARLAMLAVYLADVDGDEGTQAFYQEWVRAHDAALIESLADATSKPTNGAPYEVWAWCSDWLRDRARQVREGEA